jgi:hypothetical protein
MDTTIKVKTVQEQVADILDEKPGIRVSEIAKALNKTQGHISVVISEMAKRGVIIRKGFGRYALVQKQGLADDKKLESQKTNTTGGAFDPDLESYRLLDKLRSKYDRETLLKILKKIIRLLE